MKRLAAVVLPLALCALLPATVVASEAGWYAFEAACEAIKRNGGACDVNDPPVMTSKTFFVRWAGEVSDIYYDSGGSATRYRLRIAWTSSSSPYPCGQIIEKRVAEVKQMKWRSLSMSRCK